ncbi:MAG TPA: dihydrodipicolinate synthase family protein [Acetobacteraceae bacterium]|nr:dihydrodipicolinate synthase family protein [Acetobacteraceae bacterium]
MTRAADPAYEPRGVIPAALLPFHADLSIDEPAFRAHLRDLAAVEGVTAVTVNAHASEVASCTFEEQRRVLAVTRDEIGSRDLPIVNGVYADGSLEAARLAGMAAEGGAAALLVFPPGPFTLDQNAEMALAHLRRIADAAPGLPIILFQYPLASRQGYPMPTLLRLLEAMPAIRAIKDWCNDVRLHERQVRALHALSPRVNVLSTHSAWLLPSLVLGCDGLLSGAGSVIADLQARLFRAVQADDLAEARRLYDRMHPVTEAFYADPFVDMHNRMKEALVLLGRLPAAHVRPPLVRLRPEEVARIRAALVAVGLLGDEAGAARQAA